MLICEIEFWREACGQFLIFFYKQIVTDFFNEAHPGANSVVLP